MSGGFEALALLNKAVSDTLRLQILRVLSTDSLSVLELCRVFGISQPSMSHHLKVLAQAKLVSTRKEANTIFYRRSLPQEQPYFSDFARILFDQVDALPPKPELNQACDALRQQRAELSHSFFSRQSAEPLLHQTLIAQHDIYAEAILELLDKSNLPAYECVLELGSGTGDFLPQLSYRFNEVYAVDNSESMLNRAQQYAKQQGVVNAHFILGEIDSLAQSQQCFDAVVANMVLHHIANPAQVFQWVQRLLKPRGSFFVSELSVHQQSWVKERCGDLWLGFDVQELDGWARQAGLVLGESQYLGLRNGFQIAVRQFIAP